MWLLENLKLHMRLALYFISDSIAPQEMLNKHFIVYSGGPKPRGEGQL